MSDNEQLVERALNCSSACLLPSLLQDLDTQPISRDDFNEFRVMLDEQLHLLLDIVYQNRSLLSDQIYDNQLIQMRINLMLLACEQSESNPFFQTDQKILITSFEKLIKDNFLHFDDVVIRKCIQRYKDGLSKDNWKKQLGMIYGFPKFCKILIEEKSKVVDVDFMMFILSVGSNLATHFDPQYKTIGLKVYRILVEHGDKDLVKELNIHQVIYSESFRMTRKSSDTEYNDHLYECLFHAVFIEDSIVKDSKWCKFDGVMEDLLSQLGNESDAEASYLILSKIVKFCGISYSGFFIDFLSLTADQLQSQYKELKVKTAKPNLRTMRWIKKLLEIMIRESSMLIGSQKDSFRFIQAFHTIYIVSVLNIEASVLEQQLIDFTRKLLLVLMEVARTFRNDRDTIASIILFLQTISQHQKQNQELIVCIQKILEHETFK